MKHFLCTLLALVTLLCCLPTAVSAADDGLVDSGLSYTESIERIGNPHMNYPSIASVTLRPTGNAARNDRGFTWYYVNINPFSGGNELLPEGRYPQPENDQPISQDALDALDGTLQNLRLNGGSCLIRFVYDWDGVTGREPSDFDMILTHIEQLCEVVNDYADICMGFECGIIGVFGEMHSSIYCGASHANRVIDTYLNNTPDTMRLMVRSPSYITNYLGMTREQLSTFITEKGSPEYRLSYFNDGYMNSDNDLGTWGNRAQDLKFLASQSEHAPYGGEYGSAYWMLPCNACKPENAIPEMYQTHVNFIRCNVYKTEAPGAGNRNTYFGYDEYDYGPMYEKEWFPDNSAFYGVDCHTFIVAHLGYRLVLRESKLTASPKAGGTLRLTGSIENTGFANILHEPKTQIILAGIGYAYTCEVALDAGTFKSCTTTDYDLTLNLPAGMPEGDYSVYMRIAASTDTFFTSVKSGIRFANDYDIFNPNLGANLIGTVKVAAADRVGSIASDLFCEHSDACRAGALTTAGAPALFGNGMPTGGKFSLSYAAGDEIRLSALNLFAENIAATYTWKKDGQTVANTAELVIDSATAADAGDYQLTVRGNGVTTTTTAVNITVNEHTFGAYTTTASATCHTLGRAERKCTHCNMTETKLIPTRTHVESGHIITEPQCYERGKDITECTLCGDQLSYHTIALIAHDYVEDLTPAGCTTTGVLRKECSVCGDATTQIVAALGHNYVYTVQGTQANGVCSRCFEAAPTLEHNPVMNPGVSEEDFDGPLKEPVRIDYEPIVFVGEGGYVTNYKTAASTGAITFLFRVEGAQEPVQLGCFRTLTYARDDQKNLADSNDNANYYGDRLYKVTGDGLWAFTISKRVMCNRGNAGFGEIVSAMFNDPDAEADMKGTVNPNDVTTIKLVGIYDGTIPYSIVYTDGNGKVLDFSTGDHVGEVGWANKINRIPTAAELYSGQTPTKPADDEYIYTFECWEDPDGNEVTDVTSHVIVRPRFSKRENVCEHANSHSEITKAPTCEQAGERADVCDDCGMTVGAVTPVAATGHETTTTLLIREPTFKTEGEQEHYCAACLKYVRTEVLPKVANPFRDVPVGDWYADTVCFVYTRGIFGGTAPDAFSPNMTMSRAMFVTALGRIAHAPEQSREPSAFTDVPEDTYYAGYVAWAAASGIVNGRSDTIFAPNDNITREEMCTMISRFCTAQNIKMMIVPDAVEGFGDVLTFSKWSMDAIENCRRSGLVKGKGVSEYGEPLFMPKGNATRAEVATTLMRLMVTYLGESTGK